MEIIEDSKGAAGILYIGPKIAHKGAHNLIQVGSYIFGSLLSWRYCVGARIKFWRRSRVPKKGSRDEAVEIPPARKPQYFE